jgi:NAD-dependent SIR2 family protein deacetylase
MSEDRYSNFVAQETNLNDDEDLEVDGDLEVDDDLEVDEDLKVDEDRKEKNYGKIRAVARLIAKGVIKNIVLLSGAGISTSAGIPDYRSSAGIFRDLQDEHKRSIEELLTLDYIKKHPKVLLQLSQKLYNNSCDPTKAHLFGKWLNERGVLRRWYTQNVDNLELDTGIDRKKVVQAHGSMYNAPSCSGCEFAYPLKKFIQNCKQGEVSVCCSDHCSYPVRPGIVLYDESLPARFFHCVEYDFKVHDLVIVLGTSLKVTPFCYLVNKNKCVPRIVVNVCDEKYREDIRPFTGKRDVKFIGSCDEFVELFQDMIEEEECLLRLEDMML